MAVNHVCYKPPPQKGDRNSEEVQKKMNKTDKTSFKSLDP